MAYANLARSNGIPVVNDTRYFNDPNARDGMAGVLDDLFMDEDDMIEVLTEGGDEGGVKVKEGGATTPTPTPAAPPKVTPTPGGGAINTVGPMTPPPAIATASGGLSTPMLIGAGVVAIGAVGALVWAKKKGKFR